MHRLICAFVVRIWHKTRFRMTWPISTYTQYYTMFFFYLNQAEQDDKIKCILWVYKGYGKSNLLASCTSYYCKQLWHQQRSINISIVLHIIFEIWIILQTSISENCIFILYSSIAKIQGTDEKQTSTFIQNIMDWNYVFCIITVISQVPLNYCIKLLFL